MPSTDGRAVWDLVVVGAGPAGSAAALGALAERPDASVLLLDRADFPRDKPCGDGVAPHALDVLQALGAHGLADGFTPVRRMRLGYPSGSSVTADMVRAAHVVPRAVLDDRIVRAAVARGATLRRQRVRSVVPGPEGVVLDGTVRARVVVAADGAGSPTGRQLGLPATPRRRTAVAIRGYAPVHEERAHSQVIAFARRGWPAYAWSFPLGDGRANVGYGEVLPSGGPLQRAYLLRRLDELLPRAAVGATDWRAHHLPLSSGRPRLPDGRVLFVGDAASLINPMTGEGIYYAVLSGSLAGRVAVSSDEPGQAYRTALQARLGRHLRHTTALATLTRSRRVVEAGIRTARQRPQDFAALVEIGLGDGLVTAGLLRHTASGLARGLPRAWTHDEGPSR